MEGLQSDVETINLGRTEPWKLIEAVFKSGDTDWLYEEYGEEHVLVLLEQYLSGQIRARLREELCPGGTYDWVVLASIARSVRRLGNRKYDRDDLEQEARRQALEAVVKYDLREGCEFSSFLTKHLQIYLENNYLQRLQVRSPSNRRCRGLPLPPDRESYDTPAGEFVSYSPDDLRCFEVRYDPPAAMGAKELIDDLPEAERLALSRLLEIDDQEQLCESFRSKHFRSKVSAKSGIDKWQIEALKDRVEKRAGRFLLTVSEAA
jgi:hypothetical protein